MADVNMPRQAGAEQGPPTIGAHAPPRIAMAVARVCLASGSIELVWDDATVDTHTPLVSDVFGSGRRHTPAHTDVASGNGVDATNLNTVDGHVDRKVSLAKLAFDALSLKLSAPLSLREYGIDISLQSVSLQDCLTPNSNFPILIGPKDTISAPGTKDIHSGQRTGSGSKDTSTPPPPLFTAALKRLPREAETQASGRTDSPAFRLRVASRPLQVVYNHALVAEIGYFVHSIVDGFTAESGDGADGVYPHGADTYVGGVNSGTAWHKIRGGDGTSARTAGQGRGSSGRHRKRRLPSVDLDLDISAPLVVIPQSMREKGCNVVVLDLGRLRIVRAATPGSASAASLGGNFVPAPPTVHADGTPWRAYTSAGGSVPPPGDDDADLFVTPPSTPDPGSDSTCLAAVLNMNSV